MAGELVGIIGGTGLGDVLAGQLSGVSFGMETPFGKPSGPIRWAGWAIGGSSL